MFDLGAAVATANTALFAPYKVATWADIPASLKEASGPYVSDYGGYMSIGYDADKVPAPATLADLLKPEYKGKVALNGDPTQAGAAFSGVVMAALGTGGSADDIAPGVEFFKKLKAAGNFLPVDPTPGDDRVRADAGRHRLGLHQRGADRQARRQQATGRSSCPPARWSAPTTSRRSTRRPRTRPPRGCGRSSSTPTRARTSGSRASAGRCAPTRWRRPARSTRRRFAALPPATGDAGVPHRGAERQGQGVPDRQLGEGRQLTSRRSTAGAGRPGPPRRDRLRAGPAPGGARARWLGACAAVPFLAYVGVFLLWPTLIVVGGAFADGAGG